MAKTGPTPRRMRRGNPQAIRAPARGPRRTVIITTTPDDFTACTADITTAGTTAGNLRRFVDDRLMPHNQFVERVEMPALCTSGLMHRSEHCLYSITLSTRASSFAGTPTPTAFAVFMLIASSNFCWRTPRLVEGMSALPRKAGIKSRSSHKPVHPQAEWAEHVCSASQLNVNLFGNR